MPWLPEDMSPDMEPWSIEPLVLPIEPPVVPIEPLVEPIEPLVVRPEAPEVVPIEPLVLPEVVPFIEPLVEVPLVVPVVVPVCANAALPKPRVSKVARRILVVFMVWKFEVWKGRTCELPSLGNRPGSVFTDSRTG